MLSNESYASQANRCPDRGRVILAHYDEDSVVVYQAYDDAIANHAVREQRFGGPFKMARMTWIKPNFMWMMYRSNWARSPGQERVLAIRIKRDGFEALLREAVHTSFGASPIPSLEAWKAELLASDVRLQWDPDHGPSGQKLERRALQLGLRGCAVERYVKEWTVEIQDLTVFVREQREKLANWESEVLLSPREEIYVPRDPAIASRIGLEVPPMASEQIAEADGAPS